MTKRFRAVAVLFFKVGVPGLSDLLSEKSNMAAINTICSYGKIMTLSYLVNNDV